MNHLRNYKLIDLAIYDWETGMTYVATKLVAIEFSVEHLAEYEEISTGHRDYREKRMTGSISHVRLEARSTHETRMTVIDPTEPRDMSHHPIKTLNPPDLLLPP